MDALEGADARSKYEPRLSQWLGRKVEVKFERPVEAAPNVPRSGVPGVRQEELLNDDPMVRRVVDLFEARPVRVELDDGRAP